MKKVPFSSCAQEAHENNKNIFIVILLLQKIFLGQDRVHGNVPKDFPLGQALIRGFYLLLRVITKLILLRNTVS